MIRIADNQSGTLSCRDINKKIKIVSGFYGRLSKLVLNPGFNLGFSYNTYSCYRDVKTTVSTK